MQIKIKEKYKNIVVGFAGRSLPLLQRSQEDLQKLALMAKESGDKMLLRLFEDLPPTNEIKEANVISLLPLLPTIENDEKEIPTQEQSSTNIGESNKEIKRKQRSTIGSEQSDSD